MAPPPPKKKTQTLERVAVRDGENQFEVTPFAFYFEGLEVHWDVTSADRNISQVGEMRKITFETSEASRKTCFLDKCRRENI